MDRLQKKHTITKKGPTDLVTEADVASEKAVIASLEKDCPGISILAEESGGDRSNCTKAMWIIDPLDGTTNFAHGFPQFAVSIALMEKGLPKVGVVYAPVSGELFYACLGHGAWLNGDSIQVTQTATLLDALIVTGFPYDKQKHLTEVLYQLKTLLPLVRDIRRVGSAALDLAFVACGRLDSYYERALQPWDSAAGWLLVLEAGGVVTDYLGNPFSPFQQELLAANSDLHALLLPHLT